MLNLATFATRHPPTATGDIVKAIGRLQSQEIISLVGIVELGVQRLPQELQAPVDVSSLLCGFDTQGDVWSCGSS